MFVTAEATNPVVRQLPSRDRRIADDAPALLARAAGGLAGRPFLWRG
jgi:hypothetical protein